MGRSSGPSTPKHRGGGVMTKKDYELLARVLLGFEDTVKVSDLVSDLSDALAKDNARFNREIFRKECGIK